jgi:hypothetical protein
MDARRIVCTNEHLVVTLKTEPESADAFASDFMASVQDTCLYCGAKLRAETATIFDFDEWKSRADGRYATSGPPS